MSPEERQLLTGLFDRVRAAGGGQRDPEAEAFIADAVRQLPYAPYLLAQSVIVQDETLKAAAQRIEDLEAHVRNLESAGKAPATSFLGGIGKSILGAGGASSQPAPGGSPWTQMRQQQPAGQQSMGQSPAAQSPMAQSPMGQQPMSPTSPMAQGGGGGFLKGALGTAAGVAGGMMLANSLGGLLGGHNSPFGSSPAKAADLTGSGDAAPKGDALSDIDKWSDRNKDQPSDSGQAYASDTTGDDGYSSSDGDDDFDSYGSDSDSWGDGDTTDI